jgi:integrase
VFAQVSFGAGARGRCIRRIPELGHRKVGQLTVRELDDFASRKLAAGYAPATVNRMRETLRSALSTAVRQDRLIRNVARYGGGVTAALPPVDRFTDHELTLLLKAARDEHFFPILLLLARTGLRVGEACGLRWRDLDLTSMPPRLTVVWQLDRWGDLVHPKTATSRRTIPLRAEVAAELEAWRHHSSSGQTTAPTTSTAWSSPPAPGARSTSATSPASSTGRAPPPGWITAASRPSVPRSQPSSLMPACTRARPRPSSATPT